MANENLGESQQLPDTAPKVEEDFEIPEREPYWGKLIQLTINGHNTRVLTAECYHVGRAPTCELAISENDVDIDKYIMISKVHFKLARNLVEDKYLVYLEDLSSNGTFVNEVKVGKNQKVLLHNAAEISLASPKLKMYLYIDNTNTESCNFLPPNLTPRFYVLKQLGTGAFGDVRLVVDQHTYERFAMKRILKGNMTECKILNEVNILKRLKHPCIVHLEGIFDTPEAVYITLEYVSGGNLLNRIIQLKRIPEFESKIIFYQLLLGVEYLHKEGITHRDLKPENILIEVNAQGKVVLIKITDFGLSKTYTKSDLKTICGTIKYMAPEVLAHTQTFYDNKVDIWSLGVILFVCLSGQHPFTQEDNTLQLTKQIMSGKYEMHKTTWQFISKPAIQLIKKILVVNPLKRVSLPDMFQHPWLNDDLMRAQVSSVISEKSMEDLEPVLKKQKICS